ncbi:MAG: helix-turn-helix domain-containing protein [bacterium]
MIAGRRARAGTAEHGAWLHLGEASRVLGVDESTLRAWADAGRINTFRTPGGHRRFARAQLEEFLRPGRLRPPQVARSIHRQGSSLARARSVPDAPWSVALDEAARAKVKRICRGLMNAMMGFLAGGAKRRHYLRQGGRGGQVLGQTLAARGLPVAQAAQAFLHFRGVMTETVTTRLALPLEQQVQALRQMDAFLNHALLQMLDAFGTGKGAAGQ